MKSTQLLITTISISCAVLISKFSFANTNTNVKAHWHNSTTFITINLVNRGSNDSDTNQISEEASKYVRSAGKKADAGDYQGALVDLNQAIAIDPQFADAYNNRAFLKQNHLQDLKGAIADFRQAAKLYRAQGDKANFTRVSNYLPTLGSATDRENSTTNVSAADSLTNLTKAKEYINSSERKYQARDYQGALNDTNQAIALNPKLANAYALRAAVKRELQDYQGAITDYNRAIALDPKNEWSYFNRGVLKQEKLNDDSGALADYNQALVVNPQFGVALENRRRLLNRTQATHNNSQSSAGNRANNSGNGVNRKISRPQYDSVRIEKDRQEIADAKTRIQVIKYELEKLLELSKQSGSIMNMNILTRIEYLERRKSEEYRLIEQIKVRSSVLR